MQLAPGKNTQYAEKHLELISYQLGQKRIIPLIPDWLSREMCQILFWSSQLKSLFTLMEFDLHQHVPKHKSGGRGRFCWEDFAMFVWAFPIATVYTYCQMKGLWECRGEWFLKLNHLYDVFHCPMLAKFIYRLTLKERQKNINSTG